MRFGLLGPLEMRDGQGAAVAIGGPQQRLVLAMLLAAAGRVVTADALTQELWGDEPPASAAGTLQSYVSRLRRVLEGTLIWDDPGYRLDVAAPDVDFRRFEELVTDGLALLDGGDLKGGRDVLVEADALWRGPALLEFADRPFAIGLATRLEERRLAAIEARVQADLDLSHHAAAAGELAELVNQHPLREGFRAQLALALYRSGRQSEALRAIDDARRTLRDELGVDPGRPLQELEAAILAHDPSLDVDPLVHEAVAPVAAAAAPPSGLIGRRQELIELLGALRETAGDARIVVIEGEPGIGKTRLAEEVRTQAEAAGATVVWGRGYEGGAAPALWPWLPPLRSLAEGTGVEDAALDALFTGDSGTVSEAAAGLRFERFEAVARLLERAAAAQPPVVIVIDDLQWADETSLDLLSFLTARLGRGVLLILTIRRLEVGRNDGLTDALASIARRPGSRRLQLRGLTTEDTVALLEALTGRAIGHDVAVAIHTRSEGNPFYATELTRLVLGDDPSDAGAVSRADVPAGVGDVIRRRVAQLPAETGELLSAAAVMGRDVDVPLLTAVAGEPTDTVLDRLEPAIVHRLLVEIPERPSAFRFCHALVREVLVDDLSPLRRARLHLKVADAIEARGVGGDDAEVVAEHLWRAVAVGGGERAAVALERAADVAIHRVAFGTAEDLLTRAVELRRATATGPQDLEAELVAIHRLLAVARARRYFAGAASPQLLERAKDLAVRTGRRDLLADVLWVEWSAASTASRLGDAAALIDGFLGELRASPDPDLQAFAENVSGVHLWQTGHVADAAAYFERAVALHERAAAVDPSLDFAGERQILSRLFLLFMQALTGERDDAGAILEALLNEQQDRFVITEIGGFASTVAQATGDWELAERVGRRVQAIDRDADFSFYSSMCLMALGITTARNGDVDEGRRLFEHNRARYCSVGGGSALATQDASWAMALAEAGALDQATAAAARARETLEQLGERWNEPIVLLAEAAVARGSGDGDRAAALLAEAEKVAVAQGSLGLARRAATVTH